LKEIKIVEKFVLIVIQDYMQYKDCKVKIFTNDQFGTMFECSNFHEEVISLNPSNDNSLVFLNI
jgi:hypothetical protein